MILLSMMEVLTILHKLLHALALKYFLMVEIDELGRRFILL